MVAPSRSIPLRSSRAIGIESSTRAAHYAQHWLSLLGCELGSETASADIVICGGDDAFPAARCVIRLWDFQVGVAGSGTMACAVSGAAAVIGHPDGPGLPLPADMPEKWCGAYGAILALAELFRSRNGSTDKQIVYDVSAADVLRAFSLQNSGDEAERARIWHRNGRLCIDHGGIFPMGFFACKDGHVAVLGRSRRDWLQIRKAIGDPEWAQAEEFENPFKLAYDSAEADALLEQTLSAFTRDELLQRGLAEGAVIAPVFSDAEAEERNVFREDFFHQATPGMPFVAEIAGTGKAQPNRRGPIRSSAEAPLAGLRCMELCWVWSGPMVGQILADLGAEVIKVEAPRRFDLYRTRGLETERGKMDERTRIESSIYFHSLNRNKVGLTVDLKAGKGLDIARRLAGVSDLLIENFTVGTMARLGLGAEALAQANPGLVQLSMSGPGRGSAVQELRSYGLVLSALGGAETLIRDGDEFLGSPTFSISDPNAALFGVLAALAGVLKSGDGEPGRQIDLSQIEAAATLAGTGTPERNTLEAIVSVKGGKFVAISIPLGSVSDGLDVELVFAQKSLDEAKRYCRDLGGHATELRDLTETDTAPEFADCSGWVSTDHPVTGPEKLVAAPWRVNGQRPGAGKAAPVLGQDDEFVLRQILALDEADINLLNAEGVVGMPEVGNEADGMKGKS